MQGQTAEYDDRTINVSIAEKILSSSNLFDPSCFHRGADSGRSRLEHYLQQGWRDGLDLPGEIQTSWLRPYFASAGIEGPPALTYATLQLAGEPVYPTRKAAEAVAALVRHSGLFDAESYAARVGNIAGLDPALHYVVVGERLGYAPSAEFDPLYYMKRYPHIGRKPRSLLAHYVTRGRAGGRRPLSVASGLTFDNTRLEPGRETVLFVCHQASRTGAPILGYNIIKRLRQRYNVVTLILNDGVLFDDFASLSNAVVGPVSNVVDFHYADAEALAKRLRATFPIEYAILNTIDTRAMFEPLMKEMVPSVALIHEFPEHMAVYGQKPADMGRWLEWTNEIVFSTGIVAAALQKEYPHLAQRPVHIVPQGRSELPPGKVDTQRPQGDGLRKMLRPPGAENDLIILGCGTIIERKGLDLFAKCAALVAKITTERPVRFVWIGSAPPHDTYSPHLRKSLAAKGYDQAITIIDEVPDLEPAYTSADVFFLSSRLDPLPNVAIDSALRGLPVVCFADTGGIADLLASNPATDMGVVPHLDVNAVAGVIVRLANDEPSRAALGEATRRVAQATFDMDRYVSSIDRIAGDAQAMMRQRQNDYATIEADSAFDMLMFLGANDKEITREDAIRRFLARAAALSSSTQPTAGLSFRRPCAGFNPQIYVDERSGSYDTTTTNSLAHFIRTGRPDGPWRHDVVMPADVEGHVPKSPSPRIAVHGHFHYPELISDFLGKLASNGTACDLLLSTTDEEKAGLLRSAVGRYDRGEAIVRVLPNRGRDIGAFLTGFSAEIVNYDIVGHLHGKRSHQAKIFGDSLVGEKWREFLWQNLLGGLFPMMDAIINKFAASGNIGLIFAADPYPSDWDLNKPIAEDLARRMGRIEPLPRHLDFPNGTMFWARPRALEPLLKLKLDWDDYPVEPLPYDGTILHAIERLIPFAAHEAGYRYACTHVPGMTR
jgi:glycosyltransferase involved in cell wall biosynthesis